jgi:hypothetical protein
MITAAECRQASLFYMDEARVEDHTGIRTALVALNRSCTMIANQVERWRSCEPANGE